jgi:hypothetical protein
MKTLKIITVALALLVAAPNLLHAQIVKGEVFFGGNTCQVDGDECYGYRKFGVHAGAGALIPILKISNFSMDLGLEVLFNQKGAHKGDSLKLHQGSYTGFYDLKLNYAEIPLMIYFTDKDRYSLGIGASYGRVVYLDEKHNGVSTGIALGDGKLHWKENEENLPDISRVRDIDELAGIVYSSGFPDTIQISSVIANSSSYRANDFNICADLRVRLWEGLHAELRYQYSLSPIRTRMYYRDVNQSLDNRIRLQYNNCITLRLVYIFNEHRSKANKEGLKNGNTQPQTY